MRSWWGVCVLWLVAGAAWAASGDGGQPVSLSWESFHWAEYDGRTRLLREHGGRLVLGMERHDLRRPWPGTVFFARVEGVLGRVRYDGQSQGVDGDGVFRVYPLRSETDYLGVHGRLLWGQRLGLVSGRSMLDLYAGATYRLWLRDIRGGVDAGGRYAAGYREVYRQWDALVGVGVTATATRFAWMAVGLTRPLAVNEWVSLGGQTLHPRPRLGGWMTVRLEAAPGWILALEGAWDRLGASPEAGGVYQPDSRSQRMSLGIVHPW